MKYNQISIQQLDEDDAEHIMYLESKCFDCQTTFSIVTRLDDLVIPKGVHLDKTRI